MAYMRLVVNPKDELSLRRIINEPKRGMGEKTVDKLAALASIRNMSILESLEDPDILATLPSKAMEPVSQMVKAIARCRNNSAELKVSEIYDILLVETGYLKALENEGTIESEGRIENLLEFKSVIFDYEKEDPDAVPTIDGFMEKITLMSEVDNHDANEDAVVLMTMHSAKGLEFPIVFMPGMEDGLFPGHRSFDSTEGMEEERRLCYVGMTRAKERLFLTAATLRTLYGRTEYMRESQFLREVDDKLLQGDGVFKRKDSFGTGRVSGPGVQTGSIDGAASEAMAGYKPYDFLKEAKDAARRSAKKTNKEETDFYVGDRLTHPKFGPGTVIGTSESTVTVDFDSEGTKKMAKGIAPLKKI